MKNKYWVKPTLFNIKTNGRYHAVKDLLLKNPTLDADGENSFAKKLGISFFVPGDLNKGFKLTKKFNTITSFEVLEHLQNPLLYLTCIYNHLEHNGILYLTTPAKWLLKSKYHFHEYDKEELQIILYEAGFEYVNIKRIRTFRRFPIGIRPLFRKVFDLLCGQTYLITAAKFIPDEAEYYTNHN